MQTAPVLGQPEERGDQALPPLPRVATQGAGSELPAAPSTVTGREVLRGAPGDVGRSGVSDASDPVSDFTITKMSSKCGQQMPASDSPGMLIKNVLRVTSAPGATEEIHCPPPPTKHSENRGRQVRNGHQKTERQEKGAGARAPPPRALQKLAALAHPRVQTNPP